ncbi:kinase-associated lipoprotein B [Salisediminibacterium selenitireducens]|uniref:Kinase associated protein B n=1 Tax=Bacillus selenitireducens (strain ATCC 700615 / DSM 15326 / MLS10) TaxID=439292 RepID=D6XTT5_BACIE|nr:kinase-associated lipoprotein B [Salisediminibacterium selenitireducens]ADH99221.1 hypothetical protein Bsel_1713 [[Bacillus] selenitireducens MLS10]
MNLFEADQQVIASYKSGTYYGKVVRDQGSNTVLVEIQGVKKHPVQGDLHHPRQVDVPLFHERKALSEREKANIPRNAVKSFEGDMPGYEASVAAAVQEMKQDLSEDSSDFGKRALQALEEVEKAY